MLLYISELYYGKDNIDLTNEVECSRILEYLVDLKKNK